MKVGFREEADTCKRSVSVSYLTVKELKLGAD